MDSRRILVTGLSTYWGGRLAQALEAFPEVEAVIGVDNEEPQVELERTEYVKVGAQHALLRRVVEAAEIDTVVDTRLVVDSASTSSAKAHENNIIGTMNILAACSGPDSPVRKVVCKSSTHYYGCEQDDPAFFDETMRRPKPPRTPIERDIVEAEGSFEEFAEKNPETTVSILRFANVLGPDVRTSHIDLFSLPAVPMILGFDPRYQFVHEDDVVHALEHVVKHSVPGVFNVAGDGVLALSEVAGLLGKPYAPVLPPFGTGLATGLVRRLGVNIPSEALAQLRYGRGVDNRRLKATGFRYQFTSREAVLRLGEHLRLHAVVRGAQEPYRYEREVEEFLRWSPHVRNARDTQASSLTREQLTELRRLLASFAETTGLADGDGGRADDEAEERERAAEEDRAREEQRLDAAAERAEAAEEHAEAAEGLAQTAEGRAEAAEERAEAAERTAERAIQRAKKAEQRAAEAALKATERAKKAERRAGAAAEEAAQRAATAAAERATAAAEERAAAAAEERAAAAAEERVAAAAEERVAAAVEERVAAATAEERVAAAAAEPMPAEPAPAPLPESAAAPEPSPSRSAAGAPVEHYDDLAAEEVIALLASLERDDLQMLQAHERRHANRARVLSAIESVLARRETRV